MVAGFVLLVLLMMKALPELPASRTLHRLLVEEPLARLGKLGRRHLIFAAVLIGLSFTGTELLLLFGSADFLMIYAWDVSLFVDALLATWTLSTVARGKAFWQMLAARLPRLARPRARRRRPAAARKAANDSDDEGRGCAFARAA